MNIIRLFFGLILAGTAVPLVAQSGGGNTVQAVLIMASNQKGPADPRLVPFEAELQRNLPESSFRFVAEGSAPIPNRGTASIPLRQGHRVDVESSDRNARDGLVLNVRWMNGDNVVMSGTLTLQRNLPLFFVRRPSGDGEVPIVIVIAK